MGFRDSVKKAVEEANARRLNAKETHQREAEARAIRRTEIFTTLSSSCPLPLQSNESLPGGQRLFDDEFLVTVGKDWGLSSQRLTLTTHRIIYTHGRASKDVQSVYLTDVRDVRFHKPMVGHGTLVIDTASSRIEGLPAASNGAELRDKIMSLVHWARQRAQQPQTVQVATSDDLPAQLAKLAQLRDSGALSEEEFAASKAALLAKL